MVVSNTYVLTRAFEVIEQGKNSVTLQDVKCTSETELKVETIATSSTGSTQQATGTGKLIRKNLKLDLTSNDGKNTITQTFLLTKD